MAVANRALSAPLNIHGDQSDSMAQRDSGWIQIYVENAQEAYDTIIQAFRIAEDNEVLLPVMIGLDGYTISHTLENVNVLNNEVVVNFVGPRKLPMVTTHEGKTAPFKLDPENPMTMGPIALQNYYFEFKRQQEEAMKNALSVIQQMNTEYSSLSGRSYGNGLIDEYFLSDAEIAIVCIGSTAGTIKTIVDELRAEGVKAGLLRLRTFRPLPVEELRSALRNVKAIAVMDKSMTFGGFGGPVFTAIHHVLYDVKERPAIVNYIFGLGGRDTSPHELRRIYEELSRILQTNHIEKTVHYIGLRE
jgi:pyruvate ferredoxin oxidoreductase alpha subunit